MDNRGKFWSVDDDQKLMEHPQQTNTYFSQCMGRSENAIKLRRSHIAAKMYQNDPSTTLEEYVGLMYGDLDHAQALLQEWSEKRASFKSFLDANRKRKPAPQQEAPRTSSRFFPGREPPVVLPVDLPSYWHDKNPEEKISDICQSIRDESGNLASVFNDPQYVPILVQHYPGFEAYARVVQARLQ